jgi:Holliday junction resolvase RusA-like endonuclease
VILLGRLELVSFPLPEIALALSPNGRAHHMARHRAVKQVQQRVWAEAKMQHLPEMHDGLVVIRPTWTFPITRRRDGDNLTAILKGAIDALVKGGWLLDDSSEHVRLEPPVICVTKGVRMLELEFTEGTLNA